MKNSKKSSNRINKEELANQIKDAAGILAELLLSGYQLELSTSRKGFQVYKMLKTHYIINKSVIQKEEQER